MPESTVDETAQRAGERADQPSDEFDLRRHRGERFDLLGIDDLAVDVGRFDSSFLVVVGKRLECFRRRDRVLAGKDDAGWTGEKRFQLLGELVAGGDREERVLDDRIRTAVFAKLVAEFA